VQFDGMGVTAGPPARMFGVGAGRAFANDNVLIARSSRAEGSVKIMLQVLVWMLIEETKLKECQVERCARIFMSWTS
jgi:hypothetical protein